MNLPSIQALSKTYDAFLEEKVDVNLLVQASDMCRFDPRLAEIVVKHLTRRWSTYNPVELHKCLLQAQSPASMGVIFEHVAELLPDKEKVLFESFCALVMTQIPKAHFELYFVGLRKIGGKKETLDAVAALDVYRKWGYLWSQPIMPLPPATRIPVDSRKYLLSVFVQTKEQFRVRDYMAYLNHQIGRRQAELDLKAFPKLKSYGHTQGKIYYL